jgi:putative hydrolase of the HAD superfamily
MYKAIVFDFGNTLVKSASLTEALLAVVEREQATIIGAYIENEIGAMYKPDQRVQPDWKVIWKRGFNESGLSFNERVGRKHLKEFCRLNETFPQSVKLLSELKKMGFKLGLLSNVTGPHDIFQRDLETRGLAKYFDSVVWSSAIGYRKPFRKAFDIVLTDLGVQPQDALMVGDSEIADICGAIKIGMDATRISIDGNAQTKANYQVAIHSMFDDVIAIANIGSGREKHATQL